MSMPDPHPEDSWPQTVVECEGSEFDWFALDQEGRLGVFSTAGAGVIPGVVVRSGPAVYNSVIAVVLARPCCSFHRVSRESGSIADWRDYAQQGLYAFDFYDVHRVGAAKKGGYDLICRPDVALVRADLPDTIADRLPSLPIVFASTNFVPTELIPT